LKIELTPSGVQKPIRSELFSTERLEQHAKSLAEAQKIGKRTTAPVSLPRRLKQNSRLLVREYRALAATARAGKSVTSAGDWFLDNFYIVEAQTREVVRDLPGSYYRELPKLLDGPLAGYPRVYGIAWALIAHTDSALDYDRLERFVRAYQDVSPLKIGELWAIAITLRLTLIENLSRLIGAVVSRVSDAERAESAANIIMGAVAREESPEAAANTALRDQVITPAFLARFEQRLRDQGSAVDYSFREIERELSRTGAKYPALVQSEYQAQSADDISARNIITTMRLISDIDWSDFVESVGYVDRAFAQYPEFKQMDFVTRNRYRRAVEKLAWRAPLDEIQIAQAAVREAQGAARSSRSPRESDPGFYLIGGGARAFQKRIGFTPTLSQRFSRAVASTGLAGYVGAIVLVTVALLALVLSQEGDAGIWHELVVLAILGVVPASELAMALVNRAATRRLGPECLPAMSLKEGVPDTLRAILAVPVLLARENEIAEQIERMEVHYLSNPEAGLTFVMLSDWFDSDQEQTPEDQALLDFARQRIAALNARHADERPLFLLLHRRRQWNATQGKWMGWERKRGKLHELNRLLRGARDTTFLDLDDAFSRLPANVRYVITLDSDTRMPRGTAVRLIGKMAHKLNAPEIDPASGRVVAGHGILQPRVTPSLPIGTDSSLFQWAFSGPNGLDPYTFAVSDVYQDLFEEGSYVGKGIYEIDAFERALDRRIPENAVLSHDLLEGTFSRAALASDVEVVEEFPTRYDVEMQRQHRWVRGDWQLLPWIFGFGTSKHSVVQRPSLPALGRWKMIDNLRRSLAAPALLLSLIVGWALPARDAEIWTAFMVAVILVPPLLPLLAGLIPRRSGYSRRTHFRNLARDCLLALTQLLFTVSFLARIAYLALDAILRSTFRMFISRKNLLEWVTFAHSAYRRRDGSGRALALQLMGSISFTLAIFALVATRSFDNLLIATPFLALWAFSPMTARWASQAPDVEPHLQISAADRDALRVAARRTWLFFERFVTLEDNMLPPDNFQEEPLPVVAHRTSPTNIGLYFCSVLAARDFGWIGTVETVERIEQTLATLQKLARFRGHFLNWYDTSTLQPLDPRYVSTVDSGNLVGNLIVIRNACPEIANATGNANAYAGFCDALNLLRETVCRPTGRIGEQHARLLDAIARLEAWAKEPDKLCTREALGEIHNQAETLMAALSANADPQPALIEAVQALLNWAASHRRDLDLAAEDVVARLSRIAEHCGRIVDETGFEFLFDKDRNLLSIGYNVDDERRDSVAYDLLASEARLASFLAIAKGDIPTRHWFRLGRTLTPLGRASALQSWSGSMFEYLMPSLIMHEPRGSLLALSNTIAVRRQIAYASDLGLPWGISESQFNARDRNQNYQYSGFGVPDLGIKRGLGENTVIAPYASGLAAMIRPGDARRNLDRLSRMGALGSFGWYEAIDYTRARLPENASYAIIRSFMSHHQGMMILGIADAIFQGQMRERFHAEPMVKATELLLQERMPRDVSVARLPPEMNTGAVTIYDAAPRAPRKFANPHTLVPRTNLLSNGEYSVMLTVAGGGYSRWRGMNINRWQEDVTRDNWGSFIYLRDLRSGKTWSAGHQPTGQEADSYEAIFSEDRATITRRDSLLTTMLDVVVSPEDCVEVRRISITNSGTRLREIEVTSYMELALARQADDDAHPAFSKLFVRTEYDFETGALLATRQTRSPTDAQIWAAHLSVVDGESVGDVQYETDRLKFIGRNRNAGSAAAVMSGWPLSNSAGPVLDPVFSLRRRVRIPRGRTVTIAYWTMAAPSRDDIMGLIDRHKDTIAFDRAATLAATHAQSQIQYLGLVGDDSHYFQLLANYVIFADASLRAGRDILERAQPPQVALWPFGISGDLPIVVVRVSEEEDVPFVRQLLRAHDYWRLRGLAVDLAILNERPASYAQDLQRALDNVVRMADQAFGSTEGRVHMLRADLIGRDAVLALRAAARVDLNARRGPLLDQLAALMTPEKVARATAPSHQPAPAKLQAEAFDPSGLQFFNSYGGFSPDGREFVVHADVNQPTPAPWINVIANRQFGFQASAEGSGFCWALNSQQNRITPWSNDPVGNETGDAIYLRDLQTDDLWSATASPVADPAMRYVARHGQGYTRYLTSGRGIALDLLQFVPLEDPLRISRLRIANRSGRPRRLSITQFVDLVLAQTRAAAQPYIITEVDPGTRVFTARNPTSADFGGRVAFADICGKQTRWTGDRREFLGRNGRKACPASLLHEEALSGRVGAGFDACCVQQTDIALAAGEETELVFLLGQADGRDAVDALVKKYRAANLDQVFADVTRFWDEVLGVVEIHTPDQAMDLLVNRWLLYQTLACRMWGRAGFYQVSGAYGFRDQLQDSMALCHTQPALAREHLLRAAGRQFPEGDVQHWWLPESGKGIRTRISDDKAWLAYVVSHYIEATADQSVLDEQIPFLGGPPLRDSEHEAFFLPDHSDETAVLYEHCARALDASLAVGDHGLPLMGTGDWNDGMNRVGEHGRGESVWLGWFLHESMSHFIRYAEQRRDFSRVANWLVRMAALREALEVHGWDGAWYRRAYFDDGFALGSAASRECRIDSIAQAWAVISRLAPPDRAARAMEAVDKYLVRPDDRLMALFTPPFAASLHDPGYIKGYPPGIRENGGQYTHGVLWSVIAFTMMGNGDRARDLFAMINPVNHTRSRPEAERYRVEPYVACGDVYSETPNVGRGGWTWYTGSAAWMYRTAVEYMLGIRLLGDRLFLSPVIPRGWPGFEATVRRNGTTFHIMIENGPGSDIIDVLVDGKEVDAAVGILLTGRDKNCRIHAILGTRPVETRAAASGGGT
jgi:cyclic beta-1,2-glucan synthetase